MKLLDYDNKYYYLFIKNRNLNNSKKDEIEKLLKDVFLYIQDFLHIDIRGFFEVNIYIQNNIGIFIKILLKEEYSLYNKSVDLKIIVHKNEKFYFKTEDYDIISFLNNIYYYNNCFYVKLEDDINLYKFIDFGKIVYLDNIDNFIKIK